MEILNGRKVYCLRWPSDRVENDYLRRSLGADAKLRPSIVDFQRSIQKAISGSYTHIHFLFTFIDCPFLEKIISLIPQEIGIILQVSPEYLSKVEIDRLKDFNNVDIQYLVFDPKHLTDSLIKEEIVLFPTKGHLPEIEDLKKFKDIGWWFSPKESLYDPYLSVGKINDFIHQNLDSGFKFRIHRGYEIYEPRIPSDVEVEGLYQPIFENKPHELRDRESLSFVLPVYNHQKYLFRTLEHLAHLDLEVNQFEVIVVDDGSSDTLFRDIKEIYEGLDRKMNFTFLRFPRFHSRVMGDARFRAGTTRNLGSKFATGEIISFLDSDVLVPPSYGRDVIEGLKKYSLVQAKRYDMSKEFTESGKDISECRDNYDDRVQLGREYWHDFYDRGGNDQWNTWPTGWKYVCTYALSLRRDLFESLGRIRKNYSFYGFEDTDIGFRVVRNGGSLGLLETEVFHQFHEAGRSEFLNKNASRTRLLSKTGKMFFLNNLDTQIYSEMIDYMGYYYGFKYRLKWLMWFLVTWPFQRKIIFPQSLDFEDVSRS